MSVSIRLNIALIILQYPYIKITDANRAVIKNGRNIKPERATAEKIYIFATNPQVGARPASAISMTVNAIT